MKKTQKILYILATAIQMLLLISAYMINYFTKSRMGMARHIIHKNYVLESTYPITNIKYITIIVLVVLMVVLLTMYIKRKRHKSKILTRINITMALFISAFCGFISIYSSEKIRAFYYISGIFLVIILIQVTKAFVGLLYKD
ncbi:MAG: hypothetical protein ACRCXT_21500 [Paraclostridium sp.]